jgi:3-oxoacyl-[acyl-carrier protein] reductase
MKTLDFIVTNKKTLFLTGASRGIGKAIYDDLCQEYNIVSPTREELDLNSIQSIDAFFNNKNLEIDILINNAGINIIKRLEEIEISDIASISSINLVAPLRILQHAIKYMKDNKSGKVVNISSIWGVRSKECRALYSMTKFGIIGQTKALARELGEYNILVNAICPGFTATDLTLQSLSSDEIETITGQIPLKRMAKPEEIAKSVRFLVSEDNTYITGQTLIVDGGFTA